MSTKIHGLIYIAQFGFRALQSCETVVLKIIQNWTTNIEKGLQNGIVFQCLRKAFDLEQCLQTMILITQPQTGYQSVCTNDINIYMFDYMWFI